MTEPPDRKMRRDAQRNRERLLDAARSAFSSGAAVRLEAVATDAGVGIGTLYRHFPTREALVEAVYRSEVDRLAESAGALLEQLPADTALRAWMDRFETWILTKRGMVETLRGLTSSGAMQPSEMRSRLAATITRFLVTGSADGTLRGDVNARDVLASLTGIFLASGNDQQAQTARMLDLLIDGLRPRPGS